MAGRLGDVLKENNCNVLSPAFQGMLESWGMPLNVELLGAVRSLLKERAERPSAKLTEILMRGYLSMRVFEEFNELFEEVESANVHKDLNGACDLLDKMRSCGVKPNSTACATLLKGVQQNCRTAHVDRALFVVNALRLPMDELLLTSLLEACLRTSRTDLVRSILLQQSGFVSSQVKSPHLFGVLIRSYSYLGSVQGAWSIWREMRTKHIIPTSISIGCMVEALVASGDPDAGYELIHDMLSDKQTKSQVNAVIYCSVLKGFCHEKRFDRVWAVYEEMVAAHIQFSIVTYNALIDACARNGDMARVQPLMEDMARQGIEPNVITYSTIVKGYCQDNRLEKAFELLDDMKKSSCLHPDEITYNTVLDGCA